MRWIKMLKREYPPFFYSGFGSGYANKKLWKEYLDGALDYSIPDLMIIDYTVFYPSYHIEEFSRALSKTIFENKKVFPHLKKISLKYEKEFLSASKKDIKAFLNAYANYAVTVAIYFICDDIMETEVRNLLSAKLDEKDVQDLMHHLTSPYEDNFIAKEKLSLLRSPLKKHLEEFAWMHSRYGTITEYPAEKAEQQKQELIAQHYLMTHDAEKKEIKEAVKRAKKIVGKKKEHIIDIIQFFIYYRTQRTDILNKAFYLFHEEFEREANRRGLSYQEMMYCTYQEIAENKMPSKQTIEQRMKAHTVICGRDGCRVLIGKDHDNMVEEFLSAHHQATELTGRSANKGIVKGVVKIVRDASELHKIKEGDILVTSMTTPNMVQAMQKAAAFVTDEGGITCHAAIVSREMHKPCVIGTKIATKIFKDGDMVEVDADKGIVRKL